MSKEKKQLCPCCDEKIYYSKVEKEYHPKGRKGKCYKCGKNILFPTTARGLLYDKNGVAHKRFKTCIEMY